MTPLAIDMLKRMLREGSSVRVVVKGHSMRPFLRTGDVVELRPLSHPARRGDVLAVSLGGQIALHRVVRVAGTGAGRQVFLRGDGHQHEHGPHGEDDIVGALGGVCRDGRRIAPLRLLLNDRASRALSVARNARNEIRRRLARKG